MPNEILIASSISIERPTYAQMSGLGRVNPTDVTTPWSQTQHQGGPLALILGGDSVTDGL